MDRTMLCSGRSLRVLDLRGKTLTEGFEARRAAFGRRTRLPLSMSASCGLADEARASAYTERLYREALRLLNAYDAAEGSVDRGLGGAGRVLPIGIVIADFGAELVAADELRIAFYQS